MNNDSNYEMSISINVLNHLGINLYSNTPAVLSEIVANAWDADAENVNIDIEPSQGIITIEDDGEGMSVLDCNNHFLKIGYDRRKAGRSTTQKHARHVMGRKGIGKLSLFAIADVIEIHSVKIEKDGKKSKSGFIMDAKKIREAIDKEASAKDGTIFRPEPVNIDRINLNRGTRIILRDLKRDISALATHLRKRLARRFSVIGEEWEFRVFVDKKEISIEDRDYFSKLQYIWVIGEGSERFLELAQKKKKFQKVDGIVDEENGFTVRGWIGTIDEQKNIEEGNNAISILAWGKLIHEDILKDLKEAGVYAKYLIGEIQADFLDNDQEADIVTSARQSVKDNDPRFQKLKDYIQKRILKAIQNVWTEWRRDGAKNKALENPKIREWYESLGRDNKKYAEQLFQKIDSFPIQKESYKKEIYKFGILAFERLRLKDSLSQLENLETLDELKFSAVFNDLDDIEATLYHEIAIERLNVIQAFKNLVDANEKERVLQNHIFDHLWLLHPSWERPTGKGRIEESVAKEFDAINAGLDDDERKGRLDIRYSTAAGKHIIIELKRAKKTVNVDELYKQVKKYRNALTKCLETHREEMQPIEIICILGEKIKEGYPGEIQILKPLNARVIYYDQLIEESLQSYEDYINKQEKLNRIRDVVNEL